MHVEHHIPVEHYDIPAHHRGREVKLSDRGNQMPEAVRTAEVHRDESAAYQNRRDREQLTEDHQVMQFFVVINIDRNDHHHGGGRHADQEGEVGNVDTPG